MKGKMFRCQDRCMRAGHYARHGSRWWFEFPTLPLQTAHNLSAFTKCFAFALGSTFVRVSATILPVGQQIKLIEPFSTMYDMKWLLEFGVAVQAQTCCS